MKIGVICLSALLLGAVVSGRRDGLSWKGAVFTACSAGESVIVWILVIGALMLLGGM